MSSRSPKLLFPVVRFFLLSGLVLLLSQVRPFLVLEVAAFRGPTLIYHARALSSAAPRSISTGIYYKHGTDDDQVTKEEKDKGASWADVYNIKRQKYGIGSKPESAFNLASRTFVSQGSSIVKEALAGVGIFAKDYIPPEEKPPNCLGLTLDSEAVKDAERKREARAGEKVETNPASRALYDAGCYVLDELFVGRPIARFWFLETIARMPYFSYVSMLHLYESFGWWRDPQLRKVHNAEEYNELHHLLIMETLAVMIAGAIDSWVIMLPLDIIGPSMPSSSFHLAPLTNSWSFWKLTRWIHTPRSILKTRKGFLSYQLLRSQAPTIKARICISLMTFKS